MPESISRFVSNTTRCAALEHDYRQLLEASPDALVIVNSAAEIVILNVQAERLFGYPRHELLGQRIETLLPERYRQRYPKYKAGLSAEQQPLLSTGIVLHALRKDGSEFSAEISLSSVHTKNGVFILNAIRDIGLRRQAEDQLQQSRDAFRLMVESIKDYAIFMLDVEGRVMTWNAGAEIIKGYRPDEIIGKHFSTFYPAEPAARGRPDWELSVAASVGRFEEQGWRLRKNGSQFWADVVITALRDVSGSLRGFAKVTRDMTDRKRAEALQEAQAANLLSANKELEAFAYSVSHDLRAPLRHLDGFSNLLRKSHYSQLNASGQRFLDKISKSAQEMGVLVDDLLEFSRLRRAEVASVRIDLKQLQAEVRRALEPDTASRNLVWLIGDLPEVYGDRPMLRQVFVNLLSNAVKYTRDRPEARIEIGCFAGAADHTTIFVRDNGVGFDMRYVDKLFNVFQRLHSGDFEGVGVGLANVRRIVERHGGRAWAEGVLNQGATFYFSLANTPLLQYRTNE